MPITMNLSWKTYDPRWLVELAKKTHPDKPRVAEALAQCTKCARENEKYIYFVIPARPNEPGAEWQFKENIILEHPTEGDIVLDVLRDGRVGGAEFLSKL